jgi:hypothetical protein
LGGPKSLAIIKAALANNRTEVREAAIRGLCNWPDVEVADQLLQIAERDENPSHRRPALRAYVRVVTLKSQRPASETLSMLERAMKLASQNEDKSLILDRVATMRSLKAIMWLAPYLDNPELKQTACAAILEAAHDRSLRSTNQQQLAPILEKIISVSDDPSVRQHAKQFQLGL